jgi:hypothetical protein
MRTAAAQVSLATLLLFSSAGAEAAGKRIGVPKFEGAQEATVRKKVMQLIKAHGYELVRSREIADAMKSTGAGIDSDDGLKTLAKELALSAIVTGEVGPKRAKIVVHDGGEGSLLGDASFSGANPRKLAAVVGQTFWKKLGPDVGRGHVPSDAKKPGKSSGAASPEDDESAEGGEAGAATGESGEGEAAPPKAKDDSSAAAEGSASEEGAAPVKKKSKVKMETPPEEASTPSVPSGRPWLDFELGMGGLSRSLTFNQVVTTNLLSYKLGAGPVAVANVVMYPLDPLVGGVLGNIGLEAAIQQGFAISSTLTNGGTSTTYNDVVHDYAGGVRYRIPFAGVDDVYVSATYGEDAYTFLGRSATNVLNIPDTIYHYFRPGLGLDLAIVRGLSVALGGGYRVVLNHAGPQFDSSAFFPRSTVAGADAELEARYALSEMFQVRAGVEWRRYWFAMHSQSGDNTIAGGATDQSFAYTARIAILIGGSSVPKAEGGAEEAPPPPPPNPKAHGRHKPSDEESGGDSDAEGAGGGSKSGGDSDE